VRLENTPREGPEIITTATPLNSNRHSNSRSQSSQQSTNIEPGLHKCLQALVKCYAERLDQRFSDSHKNSSSDNESAYSVPPSGSDTHKNSLAHNLANNYGNEPEINTKSTTVPLAGNKNRFNKQPSEAESIVDVENALKSGKSSGITHNSKRPWK